MKLTTDNLSLFSDSDGKSEKLPTNTLSHNYRIQRWANFIAGYSIEFVEACLSDKEPNENVVLDPFLGCGTTLVAARNLGFNSVGYEIHPIFYTLAQAKLKNYVSNDIDEIAYKLLTETMPIKWSNDAHKFIAKMYSEANREAISRAATAVNSTQAASKPLTVALFLKACEMACDAQTDGIYKAPDSKKNSILFQSAIELVASTFKEDIDSDWYKTHWVNQPIPCCHLKSAESMVELENKSIGICITSPPYLNNFDFAEMTRLHLYLLGWADSWKNITQLVRKNLIINTTTALQNRKTHEFQTQKKDSLPLNLREELALIVDELSAEKKHRAGKKEYDFLVYPYYSQIQSVLQEVFRVLKSGGQVHWVIGDAALYGIHIETHQHTKTIMETIGFSEVTINFIRKRGHRWVLSKRDGAKKGLGEYHIVAYKS
ncbi:DNA methyltransferase [Candidatus Parabeggiatoa sp. HSG14]|uniref:DNA methyltransferase n=1 Tax=Candidatus Parabeggiatoa sp. HSG14 TaxID=3055593 RepID=UPI0025A890CD|nr:DNA methyltransferase [Thiotrichales bacterium HSG14]